MAPFIILDRDGVINAESADYIKSVDEWRPLPGSIEAIAQLTTSGYDVFVSPGCGAGRDAGAGCGELQLLETIATDPAHPKSVVTVHTVPGFRYRAQIRAWTAVGPGELSDAVVWNAVEVRWESAPQ